MVRVAGKPPGPSRFYTCSQPDCRRASVRGRGCMHCGWTLCNTHHLTHVKACPNYVDIHCTEWPKKMAAEADAIHRRINVRALEALASALNGGKSCRVKAGLELPGQAAWQWCNYTAYVRFSKSERWLVQIPHGYAGQPPSELVEYITESEFATLRFLQDTSVPAPRAFAYGLASDPHNEVGVTFLLMEEPAGTLFDGSSAKEEDHKRVLEGMAAAMIEISRHPQELGGSLCIEKGEQTEQELAVSRLQHHHQHIEQQDQLRIGRTASGDPSNWLDLHGPYKDEASYFAGLVDHQLDLVADQQLHPQCSQEAFVFYTIYRDCIESGRLPKGDGHFYLKNVSRQLGRSHIYVDTEGQISSITGWQFARFVPAPEAFGPGILTANRGELSTYRHGLTPADRFLANCLDSQGRTDLGKWARESEAIRRLHWGLGDDRESGDCDRLRAHDLCLGALYATGCIHDCNRDNVGMLNSQPLRWANKKLNRWKNLANDDPRSQKLEL